LFVKGLKSVWYSSSVSSVKPELSSVYIYINDGNLVFAATDSFRLAEKKIKAPVLTNLSDILIPFKNIPDIIRILEGMGEEVKVLINKNLISFTSKDVYLVSRLIDGVFPDYRQIIPKNFSTEAVMLKQDLINALKISNIFSDKFNQIHLTIDPKEKSFQIQTKNSDIGENSTAVDSALTGDRIEINFNYKYIADCFQSIDADSISLQLSGINRPMVIRPVSGDQSFMYLAMPMNR
jgi:DNA polymerase-3 subunit beta